MKVAGAQQGPCFACENTNPTLQTCIDGDWGTTCTYYWYQGVRYCSTGGESCGGGGGGDPGGELALLSPAGTYLPQSLDRVIDGWHACTGFVVSFQTRGVHDEPTLELRPGRQPEPKPANRSPHAPIVI